MSTATAAISHECPPAGELQLEDWSFWGDLLELDLLHEGGELDVQVYGTPVLREVFRGAELYGFRLNRIVFQDKDHGIPVNVIHAVDLPPVKRSEWQAEAFAIIDQHEGLRTTVEEKQFGQFC